MKAVEWSICVRFYLVSLSSPVLYFAIYFLLPSVSRLDFHSAKTLLISHFPPPAKGSAGGARGEAHLGLVSLCCEICSGGGVLRGERRVLMFVAASLTAH